MAGYKRPRDVEFRDSLPLSQVGKVLPRVLKEEELQKKGKKLQCERPPSSVSALRGTVRAPIHENESLHDGADVHRATYVLTGPKVSELLNSSEKYHFNLC